MQKDWQIIKVAGQIFARTFFRGQIFAKKPDNFSQDNFSARTNFRTDEFSHGQFFPTIFSPPHISA